MGRWIVRAAFVSVVLAELLAFAAPSQAKNVALVIGNSNYKIGALKNPIRDAAAISDRLKDLDFEVTEAFDADAFSMNRAAEGFLRTARESNFALFYFAGHGIQLFDRNFLLARDLNTLSATTPKDLGIDLTQFMAKLREAGPVRVAFLIDACRDNPLTFDETVDLMRRLKGTEGTPAASATVPTRGLARVELSQAQAGGRHSAETLVFFSAQPGTVSYDGEGQNSYFVEGIKDGLSHPGEPLSKIFRDAGAYVRTVTLGEQAPQIVSDWTGDVVLQGGQAAKVSYDIFSNAPDGKLSKKDEELVMKSVSGYSRFVGDFIARASIDSVENSELSDSEKRHVPEVGGVNGFSISYDLNRDGRD
jgi:hypothetical protein